MQYKLTEYDKNGNQVVQKVGSLPEALQHIKAVKDRSPKSEYSVNLSVTKSIQFEEIDQVFRV